MQKTAKFRLTPSPEGFRVEPLTQASDELALIQELCVSRLHALEKPLPGDMVTAVGTLMVRAHDLGLQLEPKGQLHAPVLHLSRIEQLPPVAGELRPFWGLHGRYAAHWGLTDLYPEHAAALQHAITGGEPFDTGRFGAKKEIEYGRLRRSSRRGPIEVKVWCEADDGVALADTAVWRVAGGNEACSCGADALMQLGLADHQIAAELENLAAAAAIGDTNEAMRERVIAAESDFDDVIATLEELCGAASAELSERTKRMEALARARLEALGWPAKRGP